MILDSTLSLKAALAGAVSANQPEAHIDYQIWTNSKESTNPATVRVALNNSSDVTLLAAPATSGYVAEILRIAIYNKDTASVTITVKTDDGTTQRIMAKVILATLESLNFEKEGNGWYVMASNGAIKNGSGISGPGSSTNNGLVRWNGTSGTVVQDSSDLTYDGTTLTLGSSKFTVAAASGNTSVGGTLGVTGALTAGTAGASVHTFSGIDRIVTLASGSSSANSLLRFKDSAANKFTIGYNKPSTTDCFIIYDDVNSQYIAQFIGVASATRYFTVTNSNGGNSEIDVSAGLLSIGSTSVTINIKSGGSTTISTGVGSVKMSTGNAATNTAWIPLAYAGTTYYVPAWTTNAP